MKRLGVLIMLALALAACQQDAVSAAVGLEPAKKPKTAAANPDAGRNTQKVLAYLASLKNRTTNKVLSGQFISHDGGDVRAEYEHNVAGLFRQTGKYPAYIESGYTTADLAPVNDVLTGHWRAGGIVGASVHFDSPWGGKAVVSDYFVPKPDLRTILTTAQGSAPKTAWFAMLDRVAAGLQVLEDRGVVVILRPFHEMNGDWFWWGYDHTRDNSEDYKALWVDTFTYLTKTKGLGNVLFAYGTSVSWHTPVLKYYPGNAYVDLVGFDRYDDTLEVWRASDYEDIKSTGKPLIFAETGPLEQRDGTWDTRTLINRIRSDQPDMISFLEWSSWTENGVYKHLALVDNRYAAELLADPWVITRDEVRWR